MPQPDPEPATPTALPGLSITDTTGNPNNLNLGWSLFHVPVGSTSGPGYFTLTNPGDATLELDFSGVTGAAADDYQVTLQSLRDARLRGSGASVEPGGSVRLKVTFTADAVGQADANIRVTSNAPDRGAVSLALVGQGLPVSTPGDTPNPGDAGPGTSDPGNAGGGTPGTGPVADGGNNPGAGDTPDASTGNDGQPTAGPSDLPPRVAHNGQYLVTRDNTTLENLAISDKLIIRANNVTLRNVSANRMVQARPFRGLLVEDCQFHGNNLQDNMGMVLQPDTRVYRTSVRGHKDGVYFETGGPILLDQVEVDIRSVFPDNHSDGVTCPFERNFNGNSNFVIQNSRIWAEGKTAAFNQQGRPMLVRNSAWSGPVYTCTGSRFENSQATNPDAVRFHGKVVPWKVSWETFHAGVHWDVSKYTGNSFSFDMALYD